MTPRRAKVVHVSSVHRATDARIFEKECKSLSRAGYDVSLVAMEPPGPPDPGVRVTTLRPSGNRLVRMTTRPAWSIWKAIRQRPDIVHLHDPELILWGALLRLLGFTVVFDAHEDLPESIGHKAYLSPRARRLAQAFSLALVRIADRSARGVVTATPHIAERYRRTDVAVVQNYPLMDEWTVASPEALRSRRLVYVGGISASRGLWQMADATLVLASSHSARLSLAGPIAADVLEALQQHPAWPHIDYLGMLDRRAVADLLASSSVGLSTLLPEPNYLNGIPTKLYEYMAAGIPSVVSDFPKWREMVVGPVGLVADPTDAVAIASAIRELFDDPAAAAAMGSRGRERVERERNWDNEARALLGLYERLLKA